jgi:hypothetical protein
MSISPVPEPPVTLGGPAAEHYCTGCGRVHGNDDQAAAVKIAKINADRDVRVAEIARGETRTVAELGAETDIAVAEIQAAAGVEETAALAEGIAEAGGPDAVPEITSVAIADAEPEVQASIAPRDDDAGDDDGPPPPAKSSLSYWP